MIELSHLEIKQFLYWIYYKVHINYKWKEFQQQSIELSFILVAQVDKDIWEQVQDQQQVQIKCHNMVLVIKDTNLLKESVELKYINHILLSLMVQTTEA